MSAFNTKKTENGEGGGEMTESICGIDLPIIFAKNASFKEKMNSCFFMTFNIIVSHIFPGNFIEIAQVV